MYTKGKNLKWLFCTTIFTTININRLGVGGGVVPNLVLIFGGVNTSFMFERQSVNFPTHLEHTNNFTVPNFPALTSICSVAISSQSWLHMFGFWDSFSFSLFYNNPSAFLTEFYETTTLHTQSLSIVIEGECWNEHWNRFFCSIHDYSSSQNCLDTAS